MKNKYGVMINGVVLYDDPESGDIAVSFEADTKVEILKEIEAPSYASGVAYVIFDGKEALTVDKSFVKLEGE